MVEASSRKMSVRCIIGSEGLNIYALLDMAPVLCRRVTRCPRSDPAPGLSSGESALSGLDNMGQQWMAGSFMLDPGCLSTDGNSVR